MNRTQFQSSFNLTHANSRALPLSSAPMPGRPRAHAPIRVVLLDSDETIHQTICQASQVIGTSWLLEPYSIAAPAMASILRASPQVVIMEISAPGDCNLDCLRRLTATLPALPVLVHTVRADQ